MAAERPWDKLSDFVGNYEGYWNKRYGTFVYRLLWLQWWRLFWQSVHSEKRVIMLAAAGESMVE